MARSAWRSLQLLLAALVLASACCLAVSAESGLGMEDSSVSFSALELDSSLDMAASLERSMTDRELFQSQQTATGLPQPEPEPLCAGLNLISEVPCAVYVARPTLLDHIKVVLSPDDAAVIAQLGNIELSLTAVYGSITFANTEGVTFNGPSVSATQTQLVGSLTSVNTVLKALYFAPATAFYGYAEIQWALTHDGTANIPRTNGTIIVVVGSLDLAPSLTPLAEDGVLAGFDMNENSVSPSFAGVVINDPQQTSQTKYQITITSFEGTLNLAQKSNLKYTTDTPNKQVFTGLPVDVNAALAELTFASSAWGPAQGHAGFIIVLLNTFVKTTGFIQGDITNHATHSTPIAGALAACRVDAITASAARITWDALPAGFQATAATPAPTGYLMQFSESASGPWATGYEGANTVQTLTGLSRGTVYYCQVSAVNAGGNSPASPVVPFTTLPNAPGAVSGAGVVSATANSVTLSWTAPADNGGGAITSYRVTAQQTAVLGTTQGIQVSVAFSTSITIAGLQGSTAYTFSIVAANAGGVGAAATVSGATLGRGPVIVSYVAQGPSTGANTYSADVDFVIGFDMATNTPAVDSTAAIDALLSFKPAVGKSYTGAWTDSKTLRINIVDAGSASPVIGTATVSVRGVILAAGGNSASSPSTSPALAGSFGASGSLPGQVLIGKDVADSAEGQLVSLGVTINIAPLFADGSYQLTASVISPRLPDSYLVGASGFSPANGLTIAVSGAPVAIQSALATLQYQPAPGFSGPVSVSIQLTNKVNGELLASLVTALNIRAAAALPTVTAPDSVDVILEQFTAVPGVQIGYTDASAAASATFAVTVSTTHTGSAVFGTAAPGVQFTPVVGTNSVSYQLVGGLSALNAALAKLQVKFTFSANSAQRNFAPDPYTVLVEVSDMAGSNATRSVNANINCNTATVTAPKVVSARLDDSLNSITATLDVPVSDAFLASPVFECSALLDAQSVGLLGATPVCRWVSTIAFQLDLGMGATFVPVSHSLNIKAGALQRCVGGSNASPAQTVSVSGPLNPSAPAVFISGPKVTGLCNPLVLQAIVSMVGGRTPVLAWTLPRNLNPNYLPTDVSGRILEVNPLAFGDGGSNFTFTLVATNYLGQASVLQSKTVFATNLPVPLIFPLGVTQIAQTADRAVRIYNSVNTCEGALVPMVFKWSITPALQAGTSVVLTSPNLVLPSNVLLPNVTYTATLRVAIASNAAELYTEIDYLINVEASPLTAYIAGGEWRKVRADAAGWTVDGSRCQDPDAVSVGLLRMARAAAGVTTELAAASEFAADQYTFSWVCTTATGDKCFNSLTGQSLVLASTAVLTMPAGALKVGVYTFTLTYTHSASGRSATTSTLIAVRQGTNPTAYGAKGSVDVLLDVFEVVISPQQKLHLVSSLPAYYSDSLTDLQYTWEVLGGGASGITTATLANNANVQGFNTSTLVLNSQELEGFFVPGTDYHFKVTVSHVNDPEAVADAGQALVYVRVNALPTCDSFTANPNVDAASAGTAVAFNSTVTVSALNCYDSDSAELLTYTFFRVDEQGNRFDLLPVSQSPLGRVPLLPTGSASNKDLVTVGVLVTDRQGGRVEYTKEVKSVANELLRAASGKPAIDEVAALQGLYTNGWQASAALTQDSETLLVTQAAILTELNEVAALGSLSATQASALLSFKKSLLTDIGKDAATLPSIQILQALVELVEDEANTDKALLASTIDFVAARAPLEGGAGLDSDLLETYVRVLKQGLDYVVASTGAVSTSGSASRRLFSVHESMELGVAEGTATAADPSAIVSSVLATLNLLARDISSYSLVTAGESYLVTLDNSQGLTGAVGRAAQGQAANVSTLDGFGVLVSPTAFSSLSAGSFVDFGVWGLSPVPFLGLLAPADAATIVSGGASVAAFQPTKSQASTAVSAFASGDVEVVVPLAIELASCVEGSYTQTTSDAAASGNVYGNMCRIGCKVWNGASFSDAGATMVALHPLSKRVVCGLSAPGVAVAYNTRLTAPYVIPADETVTDGTDVSGPTEQENGLPFGVVRASLLLQPAPVMTDINSFKSQISTDFSAILGVATTRAIVRAVSTNGDASTVIWDFLPPTTDSPDSTESQDYYNALIKKDQGAFTPQPVLQYTQLATISQLCQDGVYRHTCSSSSRASWELPVIITACCLVFLCIVACCVYACVRLRRSRAAGGDSLKMAPPMMGTDLVPAKKFVYTAPNSESGNANEDKPSEITVMAKGLEFEPSTLSGVGAAGDANEASKNRLAAKFPNKAGAAAAAGVAGAAAGVAGEEAKEDSQKSSHHFYYVDESVKVAPTPSGASRRESGVAFSLNGGGARNELSGSGNSRSGNSQSQPGTPASDQRKRRGSAPGVNPDEAAAAVDKAALPVVRPGGK